VCFIDYDNDGWLDVFCFREPDSKARPRGQAIGCTKTIATEPSPMLQKAGLNAVGWASGVCVGDYNNDGFEDLFVTYFGENRLYATTATAPSPSDKDAGLWNDEPRWGAGCSFVVTIATAISI